MKNMLLIWNANGLRFNLIFQTSKYSFLRPKSLLNSSFAQKCQLELLNLCSNMAVSLHVVTNKIHSSEFYFSQNIYFSLLAI